MLGAWGAPSLAIVWTQFFSCCIDHSQGVAWGAHGGVSSLDGHRQKVREHCILSVPVDRKAGGPWRVLQKEKELEWVGIYPCSSALYSQPCSCARWSNERPRAPDKLRPDGGYFPTITLQRRALELVQLLVCGKMTITVSFRGILIYVLKHTVSLEDPFVRCQLWHLFRYSISHMMGCVRSSEWGWNIANLGIVFYQSYWKHILTILYMKY